MCFSCLYPKGNIFTEMFQKAENRSHEKCVQILTQAQMDGKFGFYAISSDLTFEVCYKFCKYCHTVAFLPVSLVILGMVYPHQSFLKD